MDSTLDLASNATTLPTLYEYYTAGGIASGLNADQSFFTLNEKNITLYSGAMHYFRTPKKLWRDRLRKMRAAGLNAVETYVPWNLHEPRPGEFDFGKGGSDMEDFLDVETFLRTAQEEDLLAILRPGPYICAEFEFGGLPSWLLREKDIKFRTSDPKYMEPVKRFFNALLPILAALQFVNGGPIISFQVENEYGSTQSASFKTDKHYLKELRNIYLSHNITELLTTADGVTTYKTAGTITKYFLVTANFNSDPRPSFDALESFQPGRPKMAMEFYPGWFDHWSETHHTTSALDLTLNLELILTYPGSVNIYMFHGGTSFGFTNGANLNNQLTDNSEFQPDTTSYDYDSPLTEAGDYTVKYDLVKALLGKYAEPKTKLPDQPDLVPRVAYPDISVVQHIPMKLLIDTQNVKLEYPKPTAMELLDINNGSGQSYGYLVYRKKNVDLSPGATLTIGGHVCDSVIVLINGNLVSPPLKTSDDLSKFGFWKLKDSRLVLTDDVPISNATLDLVVENWGRVNYGKLPQYYQFKGLWQGDLLLNDEILTDWQHVPLQFEKRWTLSLQGWQNVQNETGPGLYKAVLNIDKPQDTYVDMRSWTKGIVVVNGFVLGRYARIGPQQCLYLPAPLLRPGRNELVIFEHYEAADTVSFSTDQIWDTV